MVDTAGSAGRFARPGSAVPAVGRELTASEDQKAEAEGHAAPEKPDDQKIATDAGPRDETPFDDHRIGTRLAEGFQKPRDASGDPADTV